MLSSKATKIMLISLVVNLLFLSSILWAVDYSNDSDITKAIEKKTRL